MTLGNYFPKIPSGNRLQDLCKWLQVLKIWIKTFSAAGNRLPESKSQFEMIEFFGQTFHLFSIWKLLPEDSRDQLDHISWFSWILVLNKLRSTWSFGIIKTSCFCIGVIWLNPSIEKNSSAISRPWKILFAKINCFFHSSSLRGCENKTTIGTSKPYTGATRGTMQKPQANLGAD